MANPGIIAGSAVGITVFVVALLLIVVSIAVCAVTRKSKWSLLNQSYASVHEVDSRNAQLLTCTEEPYDYIRCSPFFQGPDGLITKKNSAYQPTHVEMMPNIAYGNKTALNCQNSLMQSMLQNNEYAYIGQHT